MKVESFTDANGFKDDLSMPVAGSPIVSMSLFNDFVESSANFL
jgi:hypothetical protein